MLGLTLVRRADYLALHARAARADLLVERAGERELLLTLARTALDLSAQLGATRAAVARAETPVEAPMAAPAPRLSVAVVEACRRYAVDAAEVALNVAHAEDWTREAVDEAEIVRRIRAGDTGRPFTPPTAAPAGASGVAVDEGDEVLA